MKIFLYIILAIVILLLMIIIHEFGHYVAGKILKFKINEFSIGFGPKLFSKKKKNGEVFSLRLIPLGGYCAFEGETDTEETPKNTSSDVVADDSVVAKPITEAHNSRSFINEKPWKRLIVLLAGGVFNILSAVIFSFLVILIVGYAVPKIATVYYPPENDNSIYSSLQIGDEIIEINGKKINIMNTFENLINGAKLGDKYEAKIIRDGKVITLDLIVQKITADGSSYDGFGFQADRVYYNGNLGSALLYSVPFTAKLSWAILGSFFDLISGQIPITSLTGPVGTIGMMAKVSALNWRNIFLLLPLIASNLGLFNLLPIPALDGSKVVFTTIEWIRGKPINRKVENYIHTIGLFVLFAFVIVIDIVGMILR